MNFKKTIILIGFFSLFGFTLGEKIDLGGGYYQEGNQIYYQFYDESGKYISGIDIQTFKVINNKDQIKSGDNIYQWQIGFEGTRMLLQYGKDKNNIYDNGKKLVGVDTNTYQLLEYGIFAKDKNHIYFRNQYGRSLPTIVLYGVDVKTFEILNRNYAKDKNFVYYIFDCGGGSGRETCIKKIEKSDSKTFEITKGKTIYDAYDKNGVYINNSTILGADKDTLSHLNGSKNGDSYYLYLKDKNSVYYFDDDTYGDIERTKIPEANPKYFEIIEYNYFDYGKDDKNVFYKGKKIKGSDSKTFEVIEGYQSLGEYGKDNKNVYYRGEIISGADPKTFEEIIGGIAQDKSFVYLGNKIVPNVPSPVPSDFTRHQSKEFEIFNVNQDLEKEISLEEYNSLKQIDTSNYYIEEKYSEYYNYEKNKIYFNYKDKLVASNPGKNFETFGNYFAKDENFVFFYGDIVTGADPKSFTIFNGSIAYDKKNVYYYQENTRNDETEKSDNDHFIKKIGKFYKPLTENLETDRNSEIYIDKKNVYRKGEKIIGTDPKSFTRLSDEYGISSEYFVDKNNIYYNGKKIEGIDRNTFQVINSISRFDAMDKNNYYFEGKKLRQSRNKSKNFGK